MEKGSIKPTSIISFLSGKGGSGKTTASLAMAKLLADVGFRILLVDFDFATSGASYFFSPRISHLKRIGLSELIKKYSSKHNPKDSKEAFKDLVVTIDQNFDYIPSRTNLGEPFSFTTEINNKEFLLDRILRPMMTYLGKEYDYILIDNQAGYTNSSAAGAKVADKAVIVSESDRISSDAVDNLIALIGKDMPRFRRYLINKVEIKESGDYKSKAEAFKAMNRLPPLPFDFSVRNAFGDRKIPVDLEKPTAFLMALFATVKEILPENKERLEKYETEKITKLFERYQEELDDLLRRRDKLQEIMIEFQTIEKGKESDEKLFISRIRTTIAMAFTTSIPVVSIIYIFFKDISIVMATIGAYVVIIATLMTFYYFQRTLKLTKSTQLEQERTKDQLRYQKELANIEVQVDRYNNLIVTRSRDLLIDSDLFSAGKE